LTVKVVPVPREQKPAKRQAPINIAKNSCGNAQRGVKRKGNEKVELGPAGVV
jgi:hypothetical protein